MARRIPSDDKYQIIDGVKHKRCSSCKKLHPIVEFSSRSASPDGLAYSCKKCERETAMKSYKAKQQKARSKKRYEEHKEEYNERAKLRYQSNKEEILANQAIWRKSKNGREAVNAASARRRQRMIDQTPGGRDYVKEEIIERDSIDGVCICQICGEPILNMEKELQIDHMITIASGGPDIKDNVRCTHKICNSMRPKDGKDLEA